MIQSCYSGQSACNEIVHLNCASSMASRWGHHLKLSSLLKFLALFRSTFETSQNLQIAPKHPHEVAAEWQRILSSASITCTAPGFSDTRGGIWR